MLPEFDKEEINCENVIECLYGLSELDKEILSLLSEGEELRSSEIAEKIDKDQSTAYRSLEKLLSCGLIYKEKHTIRNGGYYFLYSRRPLDKVKEESMRCIEDWYEEMKGAVEELDNF
ncbi:MAG: ArsR family transcriptional regulator [Candidatus Thermoplasmatota archaeon]|nr:ArsR family transcriptional regulator [Candidatus Thermoplasmatota archaeon]